MQTVQDPHRAVRTWLYVLAALVAIMVLVGGATRLTDSGLSITEWEPLSGMIPPFTQDAWLVEFEKYKTTTEYQTVNKGMSLAQFEFIFWWEWAHRFLGRLVGLAVLIPLVVFWTTGRLNAYMKPRGALLLLAIVAQGAIGWWMVASGLVGRTDVSQLRLAVHLTMACAIFAYTLWLAFTLRPVRKVPVANLSPWAGAVTLLVVAQVFMGGLVAGLDAGMAYNTWPTMNGAMVPSGLLAIDPAWRNFIDNAMTVQFMHRVSAYVLWFAALAHAVQVFQASRPHARTATLLFAGVTGQAVVGITTLLMQVPLGWALLHQFGGVVVLAIAVYHWRNLAPRPAERMVAAPMGVLHAAE